MSLRQNVSESHADPASRTAISVVVRTLGSRRLAEALESLVRQTRRDFEVVVVDMSRGRIEEMVRHFATRLALRRVAPGRVLARPAALNTGIRAAHSPWIGVLDEDNLYDPPHLERLLAELESSGADYVYTGVRHATFTPEGRFLDSREVAIPWAFDRVILGNYVYATGSAFAKELWERVGGYDERFTVFEDWDFIIRAAQRGTFRHLPIVSGLSRKFTGLPGTSGFDLEIHSARRCLAGVYWKHRHLFRGGLRRELQLVSAEHCRRRVPVRRGLLTRTVGGWRLELGLDLVAWWASAAVHGMRRRAA